MVAAIYHGTRTCMERNTCAKLPDFVSRMLSEYTLLTFNAWFASKGREFTEEDSHRFWLKQLNPKYHEYDAQYVSLTREQRSALRHLMKGTSDYNIHYGCVAHAAVQWLEARKPDNRGKV